MIIDPTPLFGKAETFWNTDFLRLFETLHLRHRLKLPEKLHMALDRTAAIIKRWVPVQRVLKQDLCLQKRDTVRVSQFSGCYALHVQVAPLENMSTNPHCEWIVVSCGFHLRILLALIEDVENLAVLTTYHGLILLWQQVLSSSLKQHESLQSTSFN